MPLKTIQRTYGGISDPKCSLSRSTPPSVLRVIQNPFGKVIFVKKAPRTLSARRKKNLNGQITVLSIFRLFYFFQRTKFTSTDIFLQNGFWQNSRQEHNLKLTPQGFCITRNIDGVVTFAEFLFLLIFLKFAEFLFLAVREQKNVTSDLLFCIGMCFGAYRRAGPFNPKTEEAY